MSYLITDLSEGRAIERALFARHCRRSGVRAADVYAGTATLDRSALTGEPVYPPITTTGAKLAVDSAECVVEIEPFAAALNGARVEGKRLDLSARVEREALPEQWRARVT